MLATGDGLGTVGRLVLLYVAIQRIGNILVQPTVVGRSVAMHPLLVLSAVMIGSQFMGIAGVIAAVPLFGLVKVSDQTVYQRVKGTARSR